jgi:hypothetical protein
MTSIKRTFIQICNKEKSPNHPCNLSVVANHAKKVKCAYPLLLMKLNEIIYVYMYTVTIKKNN